MTDYTTSRYVRGRLDGTTASTGEPLEMIKERAKQHVDLGLCDRVEVLGKDGNVCFQWPPTMRRS